MNSCIILIILSMYVKEIDISSLFLEMYILISPVLTKNQKGSANLPLHLPLCLLQLQFVVQVLTAGNGL